MDTWIHKITMAIGYLCKLNIRVFVWILTETIPRSVMGNVCRFSVIVTGGIRCSAPGPGKHYPPSNRHRSEIAGGHNDWR